MPTTEISRNEAEGAVKQAQPDASVAREFYDAVYRNALNLQKHGSSKLYYQPRWIRGAKGDVNVESVEWKSEPWKRFLGDLDGYLDLHSEHTLMPVPALFKSPKSAKLEDVGCVAALFFDADADPLKVYGKAFLVLGKLTCVVWSGGTWLNPQTGKEEGKLHGFLRFKKPAVTPEDIAKAIEAQNLLTKITDGDKSMTVVHPLGLPGSINQKTGKLREIAPASEWSGPEVEIDLDDALAKLRAAAGVKLNGSASSTANAVKEFSGEKVGVDVEKAVMDLMEGNDRHGNATRLAAHYAGTGLKRSAARELLKGMIAGAPWGQDRKDEFFAGELDRIIDSAFDKFAVEAFSADKPLPLGVASSYAADFPVRELPSVMREAVLAVAAETVTPVAYAAMAALASASAAVCYIADVETLASGSAAPLSLYVMNTAVSGGRKTTVDAWFRKPFDAVARERKRTYAARYDLYNVSRSAQTQAERAALKAGGCNGAAVPKPVHPPAPGLIHSDATFEAVLRNMAEGGPYAVLWSAEAGMILGGAGFAKDRAQASVSTLNLAWDGVDIQRSRVGGAGGESAKRGEVVTLIACPRLVANLSIHPPLAQAFIASEMNSSQGLTARTLIAHPDPGIGHRARSQTDPKRVTLVDAFNAEIEARLRISVSNAEAVYCHFNTSVPAAAGVEEEEPETDPFASVPLEAAGNTVRNTAAAATPVQSWNGLPVLTLSKGARAALEALYDTVEPQMRVGGKLEPYVAFASKVPEQAARIAGVLTLFENAGATAVSEATMRNAIRIMEWFLDARIKFEEGVHGTEYELAQKLVNWIKANVKGDIASQRDILWRGPTRDLRDRKRLEEIARILIERGWLLPLTESEARNGVRGDDGLVKTGWRLHPAFRETNP